MALVRLGGADIVSASPERFLAVRGDRIETRPIKGTRPRGQDPAADARLAAELRASEKDRAENVMIVDLARNDLGRVARYGSVAVEQLFGLEAHPGVHHLVSTVSARLRPGIGAGRRRAGDLSARLRDGGAEGAGDRDHRRARAGPARPVLRRDRLDRAGRRPRALGRDPDLRGGGAAPAPACGRSGDGGLGSRRRVARDDAQGGAAARRRGRHARSRAGTDGRDPREGLAQRAARGRRGGLCVARRPRPAGRRRRVRDAPLLRGRAVRARATISSGSRKAQRRSCSSLPHASGSWRRLMR